MTMIKSLMMIVTQ